VSCRGVVDLVVTAAPEHAGPGAGQNARSVRVSAAAGSGLATRTAVFGERRMGALCSRTPVGASGVPAGSTAWPPLEHYVSRFA
jgi:hypothetical protein